MSRSTKLNEHLKAALTTIAVAAVLVVTLPLLAVTLFLARFVIVAALAVAIPAFAFSPALRNWLLREGEEEESYKGLRVPTDVWVHPRHSWARAVSADSAVIGVDDLVTRVLGPADELRLPALGQALVEGQDMLWLRRGGRTLAVKAPVSGTVVQANDQAAAEPATIQQSPYGSGWVLRVRPSAPLADSKNLKRGGAARQWFRDEVDRLLATISAQPVAIPVMQDGGSLSPSLHDELDEPTWQKVQKGFFESAQ